jgi:hypothetical protein
MMLYTYVMRSLHSCLSSAALRVHTSSAAVCSGRASSAVRCAPDDHDAIAAAHLTTFLSLRTSQQRPACNASVAPPLVCSTSSRLCCPLPGRHQRAQHSHCAEMPFFKLASMQVEPCDVSKLGVFDALMRNMYTRRDIRHAELEDAAADAKRAHENKLALIEDMWEAKRHLYLGIEC